MIVKCKKCFELGFRCSECKEKNKKALSREELAEKTLEQIKEGKQKKICRPKTRKIK